MKNSNIVQRTSVKLGNAQPGDGDFPLSQHTANYTPLSPLSFLQRASDVYPDHVAVIHGKRQLSFGEVYARCRQLASSLQQTGVQHGDVVSIIAPNIPELFEAHFAIPMCGAILNTINTRLEATTIAYILGHSEAKVLFVDRDSTQVVQQALATLKNPPLLIDINDPLASGAAITDLEYETFLAQGDAQFEWSLPNDEWETISLNYTSGTTGQPKGVVYHHRGAYLNAMSNITGWHMQAHPVYLWTLPMFHCNGWCFPWSLAANAGTSVCSRTVSAEVIFNSIEQFGVTHFCGAPIILNFLINADESVVKPIHKTVEVMTAAAPPPASVLARVEALGFHITHAYGLTETYGPAVMCAWKPEWNSLSSEEQSVLKARQGVRYQVLEQLDVLNPETLKPVPRDGETIGEIMFRGNIVMRGYLKNPEANEAAFKGGWFHSGDLAVMDPDGYLRILDRAKDIIISGGENISSIEIETVLYSHPNILEAAVAAKDDDHWGETPCAFVQLVNGATDSEQDIINYCREHLAHFKCPSVVVFRELPKTSTGKVQKFLLREWANSI